MKVAVIGGGSTYTPELVNGFLARIANFPVDELWLMDIDVGRLKTVGGLKRFCPIAVACAARTPSLVAPRARQRFVTRRTGSRSRP